MLGKWLAVTFFAMAGLIVDVMGFAVVFATTGTHLSAWGLRILLPAALGLLSLPFLAASIQLLISTVSRAVKENSQTSLSLIAFLPMGIGMFLVFGPCSCKQAWCNFLRLWYRTAVCQLEALMEWAAGRLL